MQTPWKIKETRSDPLSDHRPRARGRPAHRGPMTLPKRGHRGWGSFCHAFLALAFYLTSPMPLQSITSSRMASGPTQHSPSCCLQGPCPRMSRDGPPSS